MPDILMDPLFYYIQMPHINILFFKFYLFSQADRLTLIFIFLRDDLICIFHQVREHSFCVVSLGSIAVFAHTLQVEFSVPVSLALWDNMVNINITTLKFLLQRTHVYHPWLQGLLLKYSPL